MITSATPIFLNQSEGDIQSLNRWIFETIKPYIKGRTLELGSDINSLCPLFLEYNRPIHLSGINPSDIEKLRETYKSNPLLRAVHDFDFMTSKFQQSYPNTLNVFDTVIALNITMTDFGSLADNIKYIMPRGGTLVMILPAYTFIYHGLDQNLDDWKKYNRKGINNILMFNFSMLKVRYFNLAQDIAKNYFANSGLSSLITVRKN